MSEGPNTTSLPNQPQPPVFASFNPIVGLVFGHAVWSVSWPDGARGFVSIGCRVKGEGDAFDDKEDDMPGVFADLGRDPLTWRLCSFVGRSRTAPSTLSDIACIASKDRGLLTFVPLRGRDGDEAGIPSKPPGGRTGGPL